MAAVLVEALHMVSGDGDTSYARNSSVQLAILNFNAKRDGNGDLGFFKRSQQSNLKPMIEEAVASLLNDDGGVNANAYSSGIAIADLGCSSGPNTLALVSTAVDAIRRRCLELRKQPPELCIHLNDLPGNDFNLVIRSLAEYKKSQDCFGPPPVLTNIVPGSFHGRLFNKRSLHLVCSTSSLHWLSKAPEDLVRNGIPFYDRDEVVRCARRSTVTQAYARQFHNDFTQILRLRAQEMVPGGKMVFSVLGQRPGDKPESGIQVLEFANSILHKMASEGLIEEEKLDSFYIPAYGPSEKELREIIEAEGSFSIDNIALHELPHTSIITPKAMAGMLRAALEPIIVQHFGLSTDVMDEFFRIAEKLAKLVHLDEYPSKSRASVAASLTRRT